MKKLFFFFFQMRLYPPGSDEPYDGARLKRFLGVDNEYIVKQDKKNNIYLEDRLS